ncbi:MAG TPA: GAF domain-containing sensor histidine kinase [Gaiellaceae bacterium]|nr:GAF domain-containing sensor histidine kinase [Gaiellaceae bacterium]
MTALTQLARVLAQGHAAGDSTQLLQRACEELAGETFGYERTAIFRSDPGGGSVPLAACGWDDLEVLHGHLPPLEEWPLFHRAVEERGAVYAPDAQVDGDVPLGVGGALGLRSLLAVPLVAGEECLGFVLCDHGGDPFPADEAELALLTAAGEAIAAAFVPALALDQSRRVGELKSQFIALASHELRAPVAGIHGITLTLRERGDDLRPEQTEVLQRTLYEQSDRMRLLVDQLLDLTRLEANAVAIRPERFPVRARVEELVRELVPEHVEDVRLEVDPALETVADPAGFDRIVSNLVTNAFRYGAPPVTITAHQLDTHFRLFVEDCGRGVAPEFAPRLFERFTRAAPAAADGGSGLGLAIAQSFAQAQGGRLLYEDATPHGARFQLVLPVRD